MAFNKLTLFTILILSIFSCKSQTKDMSNTNPLLCDAKTGVCETKHEHSNEEQATIINKEQEITVVYFTDPICSSCWGIEPQLKKLKLEYGNALNIEYRMGGLLPDWSYNSGGISKPSDVAHHWDEVSPIYDMPIDGDVWLEDPLDSSYPPSIAFKAVQMQDEAKARLFLREIREMVFLQKKNITKLEHLTAAATKVGVDVTQFKEDYINGKAEDLFKQDLLLARQFGVRGFPTMYFINGEQQERVYGAKPYPFYEMAVLTLQPNTTKQEYSKSWEKLFNKFTSLTVREYAELSGTPRSEAVTLLNDLVKQGQLAEYTTKNGSMFTIIEK